MKSSVTELEEMSQHTSLAVSFLEGVEKRRRMLRARVRETATALARSPTWSHALEAHPILQQQPEKGTSEMVEPLSTEGFSEQPPPPPPDDKVQSILTAYQKETTVHGFSDQLPPPPPPPPPPDEKEEHSIIPARKAPLSVPEEMHLAMNEVMALQGREMLENWSVNAFARLRQAVLHAAQLPEDEQLEALSVEAADADQVASFLLHFSQRNPIRQKQVQEVLTVLSSSKQWLRALQKSPALAHAPPDVQDFVARAGNAKKKRPRKNMQDMFQEVIGWMACGKKEAQRVTKPSAGGS